MRARCPHCTSVFTTDRGGVQFCPSCGKQINVPAPAGAGQEGQTGAGPGAPPGEGMPGATGPEAGQGGGFDPGAPPPPGAGVGFGGPPPPPPYGASQPTEPEDRPTAWEERGQRGWLMGFGITLKDSLVAPDRFWREMSPTRPWTEAMFFAWICTAIGSLLGLPLSLLQLGMRQDPAALAGLPEELRAYFEAFSEPGNILGWTIGSLILYPVFFIIFAAILHVLCMLFGAGNNGFGATARAMGFAAGPLIISGIPCLNMAGIVYSLVLTVWGISATQRTDWWRPFAVLLVLTLVFCCCFGVVVAALVGAGMEAAR